MSLEKVALISMAVLCLTLMALLFWIIKRFLKITDDLTSKLMSRSLFEYESAKTATLDMQKKTQPQQVPTEDLSVLSGIV